MKPTLIALIFLLPLVASAQSKETIDSLADNTLAQLRSSWSLGISDSADLDIEMYNSFKRLFDSGATIEDDLNVFYQYKGFKKEGSYKASGKLLPFDIYAHDIALMVQVQNVSVDSVADMPSNDPLKRVFRITREVDFQKPGKYVLPDSYVAAVIGNRSNRFQSDSANQDMALRAAMKKNEDSLYTFTATEVVLVTMMLNAETNAVSITGITTVSNNVNCRNDADADAITNLQDSLPQTPGAFTANGKPDYDLDGTTDADDKCPLTYGTPVNKGCPVNYFYTNNAFDVFAGLQINNAKINLPNLNRLTFTNGIGGNEATDVLQSKRGALIKQKMRSGVTAGGNFIFYFGKQEKKTGISVGVNYTGFIDAYTMDLVNPVVYTYKSFDGIDTFRRQIKFKTLHEDIHYNVFSLPVMFNYRLHVGTKGKSVLKWQAGPSLMIFSNKSNYDAVLDFGGIYQINPVSKNDIVYYDYLDPSSPYNVYMTADSINAQSPKPGTDTVFNKLNNRNAQYGFATNKSYKSDQDLQTRFAVALHAGADWQQTISAGLTLKAGASLLYAPLFERNKNYEPVNGNDEFQSIYHGGAKGHYFAFGINVGIVYNW